MGPRQWPLRSLRTCPSAGSSKDIKPSVGRVGDSHDNALAETINGLHEAEVIHRWSWRSPQDVELATLEWVVQPHVLAWADRVPGRCEASYHQQIRDFAMPA